MPISKNDVGATRGSPAGWPGLGGARRGWIAPLAKKKPIDKPRGPSRRQNQRLRQSQCDCYAEARQVAEFAYK